MREKNKHRILGRKIHHFTSVESTNKIAFSLAEQGEVEGALVLAGSQFRGEGCRGRDWFSPPGGLWFSLILRPVSHPDYTSVYPLMGAMAVAETVRGLAPSCPVYISWPNDAVIKEKKIAGVMCKTKVEGGKLKFAILGAGINLNIDFFPSPLASTATSLLLETGRPTSPFLFLDSLLNTLEELYSPSGLHYSLLLEKIRKFSPSPDRLTEFINSEIFFFRKYGNKANEPCY